MRVLGVLVAWGVLAVLATMCFALGGSLGYRRGVRDTLAQIKNRRTGKTGCRPLPANHLRRRTSAHARPGARARRARWHVGPGAPTGRAVRGAPSRLSRAQTVAAASVAAVLLIGIPGTAIGATTARPGDSLWKVKLGLEQVRLALATTPEDDATVHVDLASARLWELESLVDADPAPAVIGDVSQDLGDHAKAASHRLQHVPTSARTKLQRRILDLTAQQVVVMDTLESDCTRDPDRDCVALAETLDETVELQESTDNVIAMADAAGSDVATPVPTPPMSVVQAEVAPPATADEDTQQEPAETAGDGASDEAPADTGGQADTTSDPAASAPAAATSSTPTVTPSATLSPSPTASPAPPPAGSPATVTAVEPSTDEKSGSGAGPTASDADAKASDAN